MPERFVGEPNFGDGLGTFRQFILDKAGLILRGNPEDAEALGLVNCAEGPYFPEGLDFRSLASVCKRAGLEASFVCVNPPSFEDAAEIKAERLSDLIKIPLPLRDCISNN